MTSIMTLVSTELYIGTQIISETIFPTNHSAGTSKLNQRTIKL